MSEFNPLEALAHLEALSHGAAVADDGPLNFKFDTDDDAFARVRELMTLKRGDEVIVHRNSGNHQRGIFAQWDDRGKAQIFYRDEDNEITLMGCPISCMTLAN